MTNCRARRVYSCSHPTRENVPREVRHRLNRTNWRPRVRSRSTISTPSTPSSPRPSQRSRWKVRQRKSLGCSKTTHMTSNNKLLIITVQVRASEAFLDTKASQDTYFKHRIRTSRRYSQRSSTIRMIIGLPGLS